jgi:hypothetical protein
VAPQLAVGDAERAERAWQQTSGVIADDDEGRAPVAGVEGDGRRLVAGEQALVYGGQRPAGLVTIGIVSISML